MEPVDYEQVIKLVDTCLEKHKESDKLLRELRRMAVDALRGNQKAIEWFHHRNNQKGDE